MKIDLNNVATFGVAGNFTGHLEQAGEARDFVNVKTDEVKAPKGIFPTYLPNLQSFSDADLEADGIPSYLRVFPFDENKIIFPVNEQKIQIEPECALLFNAEWETSDNSSKITKLSPVAFFASNDCSIRKEGAKKISEKKNWGESSKGYAVSSAIELKEFSAASKINDYRISSFLIRDNKVIQYGEDSAVRDYSYIYEKLINWMIEKLNHQANEGPLENLNKYLNKASCPKQIVVSIGATRYTEFGETNFLQIGDKTAIILYPESKYTLSVITSLLEQNKLSEKEDISVLIQEIK